MTEHQDSQNFADLFKRYRLRSQIDTLSRFGDLFAEEGMVYENSLFTRWQKGQRIPKDRRTLLSLISLFVKHKGITSVEEANGLLKSVGLCDLNEAEFILVNLKSENIEPKKIKIQIQKVGFQEPLVKETEIYNINPVSFAEIWKSHFFKIAVLLFSFGTLWFARIQIENLHNTFESYLWGGFYGFVALSGFVFFMQISKKLFWEQQSKINNYWYSAMRYFSFGLLFQWIGLMVWTFYNFTGVQVPYPSFSDVGYLLTAFCYLLGAKNLLSANLDGNKTTSVRRLFLFAIPLIAMLFFSLHYLQTFNLPVLKQTKFLLDFTYPLIGLSAILVSLFGIVFSNFKYTNVVKRNIVLLIALISYFFTDSLFVIAVQGGAYKNGGINDFLYLISQIIMCAGIVILKPLAVNKSLRILNQDYKEEEIKTNLSIDIFPQNQYKANKLV